MFVVCAAVATTTAANVKRGDRLQYAHRNLNHECCAFQLRYDFSNSRTCLTIIILFLLSFLRHFKSVAKICLFSSGAIDSEYSRSIKVTFN